MEGEATAIDKRKRLEWGKGKPLRKTVKKILHECLGVQRRGDAVIASVSRFPGR